MLTYESSDEEIREFFDRNWNTTIGAIAVMTGKTRSDIKTILMGDWWKQ
jgi:hypothetical protein|tara:strand:+ start:1061 stop:1207 length:147 start_codon:yes stop_codon:yes gene_type:complete